jgi:hypothetical protein
MPRKQIPLPIVVSRWFKEGHNFAFNSYVDLELLKTVANIMNSIYQEGMEKTFRHSLDQWDVIGIREKDLTPLDPKAANRHPYIIRTAVCSKSTTPEDEENIQHQLEKLRLPDKPGIAPDLEVYLFCPPEVPSVPVREQGVMGFASWFLGEYGLWLFVGFIAALELGLLASFPQRGIAGMLVRMVLLFVLVVVISLIRKPWPKQKDLGYLEWQWYYRLRGAKDIIGNVGQGARIIKPDGSFVEVFTDTSIQELHVFRDPDDSVAYDAQVRVWLGLLVLSGKERVMINETSLPVAFSRIYVWRRWLWQFHGRWQLDYAQWTLLRP